MLQWTLHCYQILQHILFHSICIKLTKISLKNILPNVIKIVFHFKMDKNLENILCHVFCKLYNSSFHRHSTCWPVDTGYLLFIHLTQIHYI